MLKASNQGGDIKSGEATRAGLRYVVRWSISFTVMALFVLASVAWLDRPIAFLMHDMLPKVKLLELQSHISHSFQDDPKPDIFATTALAVLIVYAVRSLFGRGLSRFQAVLILSTLALLAASAAKLQLKLIFGRTWPETWINDNPSLIRDGVYGFNPFHAGTAFESFPSGHMAVIVSVLAVYWLCYPRFRWAYAMAGAAAAATLLVMNFHFLSDLVAGAFLGGTSGWLSVSLWRAGGFKNPIADRSRLRAVSPAEGRVVSLADAAGKVRLVKSQLGKSEPCKPAEGGKP